jgi:competence protein ComEA
MLSQVLTRKEQLVLLFLGASICLGAIVLYLVRAPSEAEPIEMLASVEESTGEPEAEAPRTPAEVVHSKPVVAKIQVSIAGAVREPGLYSFDPESRVQEAIDAARGTLERSDLNDINLAARLIDGTTLTIPSYPSESTSGRATIRRPSLPPLNPPQYTVSGWQAEVADHSAELPAAKPHRSDGRIDINRATAAKLETLPGIGPKYASEIIRFREVQRFESVDDLEQVSGIGPKRLEAIRSLVTVGR